MEYLQFRILFDLKKNDFRCQEEFQIDNMKYLDRKEYVANLAKAETEDEKKSITAQEQKLRRRSLGNIRFIGELYKIKMLKGNLAFKRFLWFPLVCP